MHLLKSLHKCFWIHFHSCSFSPGLHFVWINSASSRNLFAVLTARHFPCLFFIRKTAPREWFWDLYSFGLCIKTTKRKSIIIFYFYFEHLWLRPLRVIALTPEWIKVAPTIIYLTSWKSSCYRAIFTCTVYGILLLITKQYYWIFQCIIPIIGLLFPTSSSIFLKEVLVATVVLCFTAPTVYNLCFTKE